MGLTAGNDFRQRIIYMRKAGECLEESDSTSTFPYVSAAAFAPFFAKTVSPKLLVCAAHVLGCRTRPPCRPTGRQRNTTVKPASSATPAAENRRSSRPRWTVEAPAHKDCFRR